MPGKIQITCRFFARFDEATSKILLVQLNV